jgi:hypothetical protein
MTAGTYYRFGIVEDYRSNRRTGGRRRVLSAQTEKSARNVERAREIVIRMSTNNYSALRLFMAVMYPIPVKHKKTSLLAVQNIENI